MKGFVHAILSAAFLVAAALLFTGNHLCESLDTVAAAVMGFAGTSELSLISKLTYGASGICLAIGLLCSVLAFIKTIQTDR